MASSSKNTKSRQFEIMVDFFQEHSDLAKGPLKTATAKNCAANLWKRLADELNAAGPPSRDFVGWKKVWADYKNHIKAKLRRNKSEISDTGGGPSRYCSLSPLEEQVVQLLSIDEAVNGMSGTVEFGVGLQGGSVQKDMPMHTDEVENDATAVINTSTVNTPQTPQCRNLRQNTGGRENLLQYQVENQTRFHENSIRVLEDINTNLKNLYTISKKKARLAKKEYRLSKERFEYKKKNDHEKLKIKVKKLEIKQSM